jgi:hypothetical protein
LGGKGAERLQLKGEVERDHGVRLMEAIDLIVTKQLTDRPHDETDIRFLTNKIEAQYRARLRRCSEAEAAAMLDSRDS